jgi:peptide methionine sulfoxide reductase MsrA
MNTGVKETAYLAGGCFWGMQDLLRSIPGIIKTEVGYTPHKSMRCWSDAYSSGVVCDAVDVANGVKGSQIRR